MVALRQPTTQENYDYYKKQYDSTFGDFGTTVGNNMGYIPEWASAQKERLSKREAADKQKSTFKKQLDKEKADAWAVDAKNPEVQSQAAWEEAMSLLKRDGPYTPEVTQQLVNRQADQSAAAEGVNAEDLRNSAAARGLSPDDPGIQAALRQGQAQRQQSNIAFQGDMASRAAVGNFQAQAPGLTMAAQALMNRQFGDQRQPAVQGGGMAFSTPQPQPQQQSTNTAFSSAQPQQNYAATAFQPKAPVTPTAAANKVKTVAERNAAQAAWNQSTNYGRDVYGAGHQPGQGGTGRDPVTGNLVGAFGTPSPNLKPVVNRPVVKPVAPVQGVYAGGKQYGAVPIAGY